MVASGKPGDPGFLGRNGGLWPQALPYAVDQPDHHLGGNVLLRSQKLRPLLLRGLEVVVEWQRLENACNQILFKSGRVFTGSGSGLGQVVAVIQSELSHRFILPLSQDRRVDLNSHRDRGDLFPNQIRARHHSNDQDSRIGRAYQVRDHRINGSDIAASKLLILIFY